MVEEEFYVLLARFKDSFDAMSMEIDKFLGTKTKQMLKEPDVKEIVWASKNGAKGPFELCDPKLNKGNDNYETLLRDLKASSGRKHIGKQFYWVFPDGETIGRK